MAVWMSELPMSEQMCFEMLSNDAYSRRRLMSAVRRYWRPAATDNNRLPSERKFTSLSCCIAWRRMTADAAQEVDGSVEQATLWALLWPPYVIGGALYFYSYIFNFHPVVSFYLSFFLA